MRATRSFGVLAALFPVLAPGTASAQDDTCVATVAGQTVDVGPGGGFRVSNVPASGELVRVKFVCTDANGTSYGRSGFLEIVDGGSLEVGPIETSPTPFPQVTSLEIDTGALGSAPLTSEGETVDLTVTATLSDGTTDDVTSPSKGTTYTSSNPAIASVDGDGRVTAGSTAGLVAITARNEGVTAVRPITVSFGDPGTTVVGRVLDVFGAPVPGAEVRHLGVLIATAAAGGVFESTTAIASAGQIVLSASFGSLSGQNAPVPGIPGGITDVGDIVITEVQDCDFEFDLGEAFPDLQFDDNDLEIQLGFPFPYFGQSYDSVFVNTNGNVTFDFGDSTYDPSIPSGVVNGSPRISPAFFDLDPSEVLNEGDGLFVNAHADRLVVTWWHVPEFSVGGDNTIQLKLFSDGRIVFLYNGFTYTGGQGPFAVAVSPGGSPDLVDVDYSLQTAFATAAGQAAIEDFVGNSDPFDLDIQCIRWTPNPAGGFDVSVQALGAGESSFFSKSGRVAGRVFGESGEPIPNALVQVRSLRDPGYYAAVQTTPHGRFFAAGLPAPGGVQVTAADPLTGAVSSARGIVTAGPSGVLVLEARPTPPLRPAEGQGRKGQEALSAVEAREYGAAGAPEVVLVHGGPGAPGSIAPVVREPSRDFRVIEALERPSGRAPLTVARHLADLDRAIRERASPPVAIAGHSSGALLAAAYASEHPDAISALVLIGCGTVDPESRAEFARRVAARTDAATWKRLQDPRTAETDEGLLELATRLLPAYSHDLLSEDLEVLRCDARGHRETWNDMLRLQREGVVPACFSRISAPVTMLHGEDDPHPGSWIHERLAAYIPRLGYVELPRCGHYPWLERHAHQRFFAELRRALARASR